VGSYCWISRLLSVSRRFICLRSSSPPATARLSVPIWARGGSIWSLGTSYPVCAHLGPVTHSATFETLKGFWPTRFSALVIPTRGAFPLFVTPSGIGGIVLFLICLPWNILKSAIWTSPKLAVNLERYLQELSRQIRAQTYGVILVYNVTSFRAQNLKWTYMALQWMFCSL
jgi:hypothetical protein